MYAKRTKQSDGESSKAGVNYFGRVTIKVAPLPNISAKKSFIYKDERFFLLCRGQ